MTWSPFHHPKLRGAIAWATVLTHLAACIGLLLISPGTEINADWETRLQFVQQHRTLWCAVWVVWVFSSASLLAFCLAWTAAMKLNADFARPAKAACAVVGVGVLLDFAGETTMIIAGVRENLDVASFATLVRVYQILSPAVANGLYCVGGPALSVIAWRSGWLRGPLGVLGFAVWAVGMALTVAAFLDHRQSMVVNGAGVMVLFVIFAAALGWRMYRE